MKKAVFITLKTCMVSFGVLALAETAFAKDAKRVSTDIEVREFNSVASEYYAQPTFLYHIDKKKDDRLKLAVDFIKEGTSKDVKVGYDTITFSEKRVPSYLEAIEKYFKWEAIAKKDGDLISKDITKVKANSSQYNFFKFHSGNETNHYLIINSPSFSSALSAANGERVYVPDFVFDRANAEKLKAMLESWVAGGFDEKLNTDIDDKYK